MCTNTLGEIAQQQADKLRISLTNRFLSPKELLTRYHRFYANAEPLIEPSSDVDTLTKNLFKEREAEFKNSLQKIDTTFTYDDEKHTLHVKLGTSRYTHSVDHKGYLAEMGEDGSVVGIMIFNVVL